MNIMRINLPSEMAKVQFFHKVANEGIAVGGNECPQKKNWQKIKLAKLTKKKPRISIKRLRNLANCQKTSVSLKTILTVNYLLLASYFFVGDLSSANPQRYTDSATDERVVATSA